MVTKAAFTVTLETELRDAFLAEAEAAERPVADIVGELMRDFVERRKEERGYTEFLRRKVELGRADIRAGNTFSQEEVEAEVAARRAVLLGSEVKAKG